MSRTIAPAVAPPEGRPPPEAARLAGRDGPGWLVCAAVAFVVLAMRLWLLQVWGSPVPYWDQWDAEALRLYKPWREGTWQWTSLFAAHNEHRIALTRLADLAMLGGRGHWDTWLQLEFNAALHALTAGLLMAMLWPRTAPLRAALGFGIALLFALPSDWDNALWGFQSAFYFSSLLAVLAIAGCAATREFGFRWWWGCALMLLSLFSTAAGVLTAATVLATEVLWRGLQRHGPVRWPTFVAAGLVCALGAVLFVSPPQHAAARAQTIAQFWIVFTRCLAWPHTDQGLWAVVMQLPVVCVIGWHWRRRELPDPSLRIAISLALFAWLQSAALAFGRGGGLPNHHIYSRYHGPLILGAAAQLLIVCRLAVASGRKGRLLALGWTGAAGMGLLALTTIHLSEHLPGKRAIERASLALTRHYLEHGDADFFLRYTRYPMLHPDPRVVLRVLDDPTLRPLLPAALRAPAGDPAARAPWAIRHGRTLTAIAWPLLALACAAQFIAGRRGRAPDVGA